MAREFTKFEKKIILTCYNYNEICFKTLEHLEKYINKYAFSLRNAVGTTEDYKQELKLKALKVFKRYEFELTILRDDATVTDLIFMAIRVIHNRWADLSMEFSKKKDTSLYTNSLDNSEDRNPDKDLFANEKSKTAPVLVENFNSFSVIEVNNLVENLFEILKNSEMPKETIGYLREVIYPSDYTEEMYEIWLQKTNPKNPHKNKGIPAKVICESLGIEYSKMAKIKEIIAVNLIKLGIEPEKLIKNVRIKKDTWEKYGLAKEDYLKS